MVARLGGAAANSGYVCGSTSVGDFSNAAPGGAWATWIAGRQLANCPAGTASLAQIDANTAAVAAADAAATTAIPGGAGTATIGLYKTSPTQYYTVPIAKAPGSSIGFA
jgi:hypothetical protein